MDHSLLYVSQRSLATLDPQAAVDEIVATARSRNVALNVTGGLICTTRCFAQLLEGTSAAIDELMHSIEADQRHTAVTILSQEPIIRRSLSHWAMAYNGPSTYVARQVEILVGKLQAGGAARIERLRSLIVGLATPGSANAA